MSSKPRIDVDALRRSVDLLSLLPADASPKRIGTDRYRAICSFHAEKTPSMIVSRRHGVQRYHCFGCGADGDALDYVMRTERLTFRDAAAKLSGGRDWTTVTTPTRKRATTVMLVCDGKGCGATSERADLLDAVVYEGYAGWRRRDDDGRVWCPACCKRADQRRRARVLDDVDI